MESTRRWVRLLLRDGAQRLIIAFDSKYRSALGGRFAEHELIFFDNTIEPMAIAYQSRRANVFVMRRGFGSIGREFVGAMPDLRFIHKTGSGLDWFDLDVLNERGILLANNDGFNAGSVAEHVVLLMLLCLRNAFDQLSNLRAGRWSQTTPPGDVLRLEGKTVGIVGLGQIGAHVARRVRAFGANVIAYQRKPLPALGIMGGIRWVDFDDLLRSADVVVLSVPLSAETTRLIGAEQLRLMKPSTVLINTSRGPVVDESALHQALVSGRLRAAGLDVFEEEPTPTHNPLLSLRNVYATPHVGGHSSELKGLQVEGALDNVARFVSGRRPLRLANPEVFGRVLPNGRLHAAAAAQ
jgi:phosphoglycerate dehydrogenase-like enzyme